MESSMTVIGEAAKAKARRLCAAQYIDGDNGVAHFIQQVSDAAAAVRGGLSETHQPILAPFILPEPMEPVDPLVEAVFNVLSGFEGREHAESYARTIRKHLAQRGMKIVEAL
jgi:hypothetical protein